MIRYFEDHEINSVMESSSCTITEGHVVTFAELSGDYFPLHMDEKFAKESQYGRRIVHGVLVLSIATGLFMQQAGPNPALVAYYGIDRLRFVRPVFIGNNVRIRSSVCGRNHRNSSFGLVTFEKVVLNQDDMIVIAYKDKMLFKRQPGITCSDFSDFTV